MSSRKLKVGYRKGTTVAQKVSIILVDDLDGSEAEETVTFGLDGNVYEIDLAPENAEVLRTALRPYIDAGRRTQAKRGRPKATAVAAAAKAPAKKTATAKKATGTRKRVASMDEIEAAKKS